MTQQHPAQTKGSRVVVIGAGIAGLAASARLAAQGHEVMTLERHAAPGGKMRTLPSDAGPVDAGPTVLTLRTVFDDLFAALGTRLNDHITLIPQPRLARHFWPDGSMLDLFQDHARNIDAISSFAGTHAARQFSRFSQDTKCLFDGFNDPVMQASKPSFAGLAARVAMRPGLLRAMAPMRCMAAQLARKFDDPRLAQLFGRYATYVGGSPYQSPALLSLIWQAEAAGVWAVKGGMHHLAKTIADLAIEHGAQFQYGAHVDSIETGPHGVTGVRLASGERINTNAVLFCGDPRALATGALGPDCAQVAPQTARDARSLSAHVWAFASTATGPDLAHHNVFFRADPKPEFVALARGQLPPDPTLYVCAMDRDLRTPPPETERFEIIANAPPLTAGAGHDTPQEVHTCRTRTFQTLARFGLRFAPTPPDSALTTPTGFEALFPATAGSLYGQSPHGMTAAFRRPTARTPIKGLYLAGGGTHPGAGVPMAALSARHAAEAIRTDQTSISTSPQTATPGGMSTASATRAAAPSASSGS